MPFNIKHHIMIAVGLILAAVCLIGALKTQKTSPETKRLSSLTGEIQLKVIL